MSISSQIERISTNVKNALQAVAEKKVTVPMTAGSDDLAALIRQIALYEPSYVITYSGGLASNGYSQIYAAFSDEGFDNIEFIHTAPLSSRRVIAVLSKFDETNHTVDFTCFDGEYLTVYTVDNQNNVIVRKYKAVGMILTGSGLILTDDGYSHLSASTDVTGAELSFSCTDGVAAFSVTGAELDVTDNGIGDVQMSVI